MAGKPKSSTYFQNLFFVDYYNKTSRFDRLFRVLKCVNEYVLISCQLKFEKCKDFYTILFYMNYSADLTTGKVIIEGKTKQILELPKLPGSVLVQSKDRITAGDGARAHDLAGKAAVSTATTCKVFELLNTVGVKTHFIKRASETAFVAKKCEMVPIEWVTRRVATGSFLKRHAGVKEGYRFNPPKQETFFKVCFLEKNLEYIFQIDTHKITI